MHPSVHAKTQPDKPAFIMAGSGETVTYRELEARSNRGAQLFRKLGLKPGDGIAIFMENNVHYLPVCWSAQRSGLYYTCISSRLTASEVEYIVKDCNAKIFITSNAMGAMPGELADKMPGVRKYMLNGTIPGYESFEDAVRDMPATPVADETPGADMLYSSGTTGRPKGVKGTLSGGSLTDPNPLLMLAKALYSFDENTKYLSPAPLYHAAPLRYNMTVQRLGGTTVVMEHFDAEDALRQIEKHKTTHSQWVPTMFVRLLKLSEAERRRHDLASHRIAIHAAAPCPVAVKEQMIAWWGPILFEYYSSTEGIGATTIDSAAWLAHKGSVGRALAGTIHILDDDGNELPLGESGRVFFEMPTPVPVAYHKDATKTAGLRNAQGWGSVGDVGYLDADGYLYLTDRKDFMIVSGGVNIYPQEIENLLVTHPQVADVAVFGVPNDEMGEEVKAVVQPLDMAAAGPGLAAALQDFCRQHLARYKCPRSIDFTAELPRAPTGKLYKRLLRDRYWHGHARRIN